MCAKIRGPNSRKKPCNKNDAPAEKHGICRNVHKLNKKDKATFISPSEVWSLLAPSLKEQEEREFVVDFGSMNAHVEQKKVHAGKNWSPLKDTMVIIDNGEV